MRVGSESGNSGPASFPINYLEGTLSAMKALELGPIDRPTDEAGRSTSRGFVAGRVLLSSAERWVQGYLSEFADSIRWVPPSVVSVTGCGGPGTNTESCSVSCNATLILKRRERF